MKIMNDGIEERHKGPALVVAVCVVGIIVLLAPTLLDLLF